MQNLQIPDTAETRVVPKWLFPSCFTDKSRFTSSCPDAVLIAPISAKTKKQQTSNAGEWVLRSGRGKLRETRCTSAAPPATSRSTVQNDRTKSTCCAPVPWMGAFQGEWHIYLHISPTTCIFCSIVFCNGLYLLQGLQHTKNHSI